MDTLDEIKGKIKLIGDKFEMLVKDKELNAYAGELEENLNVLHDELIDAENSLDTIEEELDKRRDPQEEDEEDLDLENEEE